MTLLVIRHDIADYPTWRAAYDGAQPVRDKHGITGARVFHAPADPNNITVLHETASLEAAQAFLDDPDLHAAMASGGVAGAPRIEVVDEV